ncbi:type II restriction endonuclease [Plebeiibacterium marinum]|uniref:EcoRV family type II restriction endonuclease n=1 Tax=Plebeiibacterium marinum TaxID=2992111 RepID=A0AAE3MFD0_9BACT|nr:type II restriction endonuclease [Plebeiobacterium marinum]MCW3806869.1 EcoRV family type II restriction endonuclease [Plebeiobacterium marinum]
MINKTKYRSEFETALGEFINDLKKYVSTESGDWSIKGFIDIYKNIYTISSDTKIVSKILEIHIFPELLRFADKAGYNLVLAEKQNYYPDLTFVNKKEDSIKFAVDLKTTFRRNDNSAGFTLGSHGAYFKERDKKKNIQFPYNEYSGHYCLGIIYTRVDFEDDLAETEIYQVNELEGKYGGDQDPIGERKVTKIENLKSITSVIKDFDFFVAPKWKIASDSRGSGNTANIGSVKDITDLKTGNGVFSKLGEDWFDEYWINYGVATMIKDGKSIPITNIWDFLEFKGRTDLFDKVGNGAKKRKE